MLVVVLVMLLLLTPGPPDRLAQVEVGPVQPPPGPGPGPGPGAGPGAGPAAAVVVLVDLVELLPQALQLAGDLRLVPGEAALPVAPGERLQQRAVLHGAGDASVDLVVRPQRQQRPDLVVSPVGRHPATGHERPPAPRCLHPTGGGGGSAHTLHVIEHPPCLRGGAVTSSHT